MERLLSTVKTKIKRGWEWSDIEIADQQYNSKMSKKYFTKIN